MCRRSRLASHTVTGLSRHLRLGEFVAHRSPTGVHLGEVVRVEPILSAGAFYRARRTDRSDDTVIRKGARIAPSDSWCGRTISSLCEPIDGNGPIVEWPASVDLQHRHRR